MKPYGRCKKVTGGNDWKIDYHMHEKGRKVKNWWEDICNFYSRSRMKQLLKKRLQDDE